MISAVLADTVDELLAGVERRETFHSADFRSGSHFERVWIDGQPHVVKYVHVDDDFLMRASGDLGCRPIRAYAAGLLDVAPDLIDHGVVGAATGHGRNGWGGALLMRDVSAQLVPPGDDPLSDDQHLRFLDHLAGMCARTWGWHDDVELLPYASRWGLFGNAAIDAERELGWIERVPAIAAEGWEAFGRRAPTEVAEGVLALWRDCTPLAEALATTPSCLVHGDWKVGNLGTAADGRTVLIDWAYVGEGPACHELGWYLALNRRKIPDGHTKERVVDDFREALRRHGVDTDGWWETQLHLSLLGALVQFGWEKALGDDEELDWWCAAARAGLARL
jgi:Phosphotransferase enzyme family